MSGPVILNTKLGSVVNIISSICMWESGSSMTVLWEYLNMWTAGFGFVMLRLYSALLNESDVLQSDQAQTQPELKRSWGVLPTHPSEK